MDDIFPFGAVDYVELASTHRLFQWQPLPTNTNKDYIVFARRAGCGFQERGEGAARTVLATTAQHAAEQVGRRGFALESAVARICREAGARVSTNVFVRDLDLIVPNVMDERRLEVVAEGLPLHGGAQLEIDTTFVSALRRDGAPRPSAATTDGVALQAARWRKEHTYPELVGPRARAKFGGAGGRGRRTLVCCDFPQVVGRGLISLRAITVASSC